MDTPTKTDLIAKRCVPCEGGVPPLSREECEALIPSVEGWSIDADARRIRRLPDTTDMKNEVILQKAHHSCYDNQLTDVGVRLVEVETAAEVRAAAADHAAKAAEIVLRDQMHGSAGADLMAREIGDLRSRSS